MPNFTIYNADGDIIRFGSTPQDISTQVIEEGELAIEGKFPDTTHYIDISVDPHIGIPKGDYDLNTLPLPCKAIIEGVEYHITEQTTFGFNFAGTYIVKIIPSREYLTKEFEVVWP